ncbi:DUF975 family protein [Clostridium sp. E02]|uniref:DUF975 family protein n=1 Tax=Clostridium sp. E02 TaxID=2487134 RepID=UPI000F548E5B|nr:DUF975 family protein [Clostridium sp. E02]
MKSSSGELKKRAKRNLKGNYGLCIGVEFIIGGVIFAFYMFLFLGVIVLSLIGDHLSLEVPMGSEMLMIILFSIFFTLLLVVVMGIFSPGILKIYMNISSGNKAKLNDLFYGFKNKPLKFLGLYALVAVISFLWVIPYLVVLVVCVITDFIPVMIVMLIATYILMAVGTILTSLYLSQSFFVMLDSPDKKIVSCIKESIEIMKGNKGRLFYISLSFMGMILLGYASFYIGFLWIFPYIRATLVEFYQDLKPELTSVSSGFEGQTYEEMQANYSVTE